MVDDPLPDLKLQVIDLRLALALLKDQVLTLEQRVELISKRLLSVDEPSGPREIGKVGSLCIATEPSSYHGRAESLSQLVARTAGTDLCIESLQLEVNTMVAQIKREMPIAARATGEGWCQPPDRGQLVPLESEKCRRLARCPPLEGRQPQQAKISAEEDGAVAALRANFDGHREGSQEAGCEALEYLVSELRQALSSEDRSLSKLQAVTSGTSTTILEGVFHPIANPEYAADLLHICSTSAVRAATFLPELMQRVCGFIHIRGYIYRRRGGKGCHRRAAIRLGVYVLRLPATKTAKWLIPLNKAVAAVLQHAGHPAETKRQHLFAQLSPDSPLSVQINFMVPE